MAFYMLRLMDAMLRQFHWFGDLDDIERAIDMTREILDSSSNTPKKGLFISLAAALLYRYRATGSASILAESILYCEQAIQEADAYDRFPHATAFLISALAESFRLYGSLSDLDRAIELSKGLPNSLPDSFNEALMHPCLTELLVCRALENSSMEDLAEAELYSSMEVETGNHNLFELILQQIKTASVSRATYERYGTLETLNRGIDALKTAILGLPKRTQLWCRGRLINEYCILLGERFERIGHIPDITHAIELMETFLDETVDGDPELAEHKLILASIFRRRYIASKDPKDLSRAIKLSQEALDENKKEWKSSDFYAEAGIALLGRYKMSQEESLQVLDEAIEHLHTAAQLAKQHRGRSLRAKQYHNLSLALQLRFEKTGILEDINKSIDWAMEADEVLPRPHFKDSLISYNIGKSRYSRFKISGSRKELNLAIAALTTAMQLIPSDAIKRLEYSVFFNGVIEHAKELDTASEPKSQEDDIEGNSDLLVYAHCSSRASR